MFTFIEIRCYQLPSGSQLIGPSDGVLKGSFSSSTHDNPRQFSTPPGLGPHSERRHGANVGSQLAPLSNFKK
jgi:hypothetical protein